MKKHAAPIIAVVLLLLSLLYVGSYLALLKPPPKTYQDLLGRRDSSYRYGGRFVECIFWPLEQADRRIRPDAWAGSTALP